MPIRITENACLALLLVYLFWLPLPFGSIVDAARLPLVLTPLVLCAVAALLRLLGADDLESTHPSSAFGTFSPRGGKKDARSRESLAPRSGERVAEGRVRGAPAYRIWSIGGVLLLAVVGLQLVPLPPGALRVLSPESLEIWTRAARVASLSGVHAASGAFPVSVDPAATRDEWFRLAALLATFQAAALLIRNHPRRVALAAALAAAAVFETLYGVREAALQRYAIWGWVNRLIYDRVTGTFVNPNHFAHYVGIILPLALFLAALAWHQSGSSRMPLRRRVVQLIENRILLFAAGALAALACVVGVLVSQSRGGLLAIGGGFALVGVRSLAHSGRRRSRAYRLLVAGMAGLLLLGGVMIWLGGQRTVIRRLIPSESERSTFVGRRIGLGAALEVWRDFPILGSGAGTFERVVSMYQSENLEKTYHRAHDDYAEIGATTGTAGFVASVVPLLGGYAALARATFGRRGRQLPWRRRAFQAAALTGLTIAMVHALFDFNFFIPANAATLAAIAGAAVAPRSATEAPPEPNAASDSA